MFPITSQARGPEQASARQAPGGIRPDIARPGNHGDPIVSPDRRSLRATKHFSGKRNYVSKRYVCPTSGAQNHTLHSRMGGLRHIAGRPLALRLAGSHGNSLDHERFRDAIAGLSGQ